MTPLRLTAFLAPALLALPALAEPAPSRWTVALAEGFERSTISFNGQPLPHHVGETVRVAFGEAPADVVTFATRSELESILRRHPNVVVIGRGSGEVLDLAEGWIPQKEILKAAGHNQSVLTFTVDDAGRLSPGWARVGKGVARFLTRFRSFGFGLAAVGNVAVGPMALHDYEHWYEAIQYHTEQLEALPPFLRPLYYLLNAPQIEMAKKGRAEFLAGGGT
jgi:hypothetical protein